MVHILDLEQTILLSDKGNEEYRTSLCCPIAIDCDRITLCAIFICYKDSILFDLVVIGKDSLEIASHRSGIGTSQILPTSDSDLISITRNILHVDLQHTSQILHVDLHSIGGIGLSRTPERNL